MTQAPEADTRRGADGAAQIHDLGYQRYQGTRKPQGTRYRIIARKVVATAWRGWWRMKMWVIGATVTAFVMSVIMYASEGVSQLARGGAKLSLTEAMLPISFPFFEISAFALALMVGAVTVAADLRTGAFEFYFSRPVRAKDYVAGKLLGLCLIMGIPLFLGPVVLAAVRVGLSASGDLLGNLSVIPKAAFIGSLATLAYASVPLAFSSLSAHKRHTLPAFAAFYFITSVIIPVVGRASDITWLDVLDLPRSVHTLAYAVFDAVPLTGGGRSSAWLAIIGLCGQSAAAVAFAHWRVSAAAQRGMGGG